MYFPTINNKEIFQSDCHEKLFTKDNITPDNVNSTGIPGSFPGNIG